LSGGLINSCESVLFPARTPVLRRDNESAANSLLQVSAAIILLRNMLMATAAHVGDGSIVAFYQTDKHPRHPTVFLR